MLEIDKIELNSRHHHDFLADYFKIVKIQKLIAH